MAHVTAELQILAQYGMIVFLYQCSFLFLVHKSMGIQIVNFGSTSSFHRIARKGETLYGVFRSISFCAGEFEKAVVWLGSHYIVL